MKKIFTVLIAALVLFSAGCAPKRVGPVYDPNKTQIYISLYSGGFGTEWFKSWTEEYNKTQPDYEFFKLEDNRDENQMLFDKIISGIGQADIYIAPTSDLWQLKNSGRLEDLSDIYNNPAPGETRPIKEKINNYELFADVYGKDSGIYALPYTQAPVGFIYDHTLFEEEGFLLKDSSTASGLTLGQDKTPGTYDDGLPETMEEFENLIKNIKRKILTPFVYAGGGIGEKMAETLAETIWVNYEGLENYKLSFSYDGTYKSPSTGTETQITPATGYKLYSESLDEGRVKAAEFIKNIFLNEQYYYPNTDMSHTLAQGTFVLEDSIAMLIDGYWWENESKRYFSEDAKDTGDPSRGFGKRDFRFMPIPAYPGAKDDGKVYITSQGEGSVFVVKQQDNDKLNAIKEFLRVYCSDARLQQFTLKSGAMLPFDYSLTQEQKNQLTPYSRNMLEMLSSENTEVVFKDLYQFSSAFSKTMYEPLRWDLRADANTTYSSLAAALNKNSKIATVAVYKQKLQQRYNADSWKQVYGGIN